MTRVVYEHATVESGDVPRFARLDLGQCYMWLYPEEEEGCVRVEFEDKSLIEVNSVRLDGGSVL